MAITQPEPSLVDEIADFLASAPSREELLQFRPSEQVQERARELLAKAKAGRLGDDERRELDGFEHREVLMRLVKARLSAVSRSAPVERISVEKS